MRNLTADEKQWLLDEADSLMEYMNCTKEEWESMDDYHLIKAVYFAMADYVRNMH